MTNGRIRLASTPRWGKVREVVARQHARSKIPRTHGLGVEAVSDVLAEERTISSPFSEFPRISVFIRIPHSHSHSHSLSHSYFASWMMYRVGPVASRMFRIRSFSPVSLEVLAMHVSILEVFDEK
jgi:hypothetical protein